MGLPAAVTNTNPSPSGGKAPKCAGRASSTTCGQRDGARARRRLGRAVRNDGRPVTVTSKGAEPHQRMQAACDAKEISSADDRAAVLDWRLDHTSLPGARDGPLPWLPGIPYRIAADPQWGPYLAARSRLVAQHADQVRLKTGGEAPAWAALLRAPMPAELVADIQVWRATTQVDPNDLRPTGPPQLGYAARIFQQQLEKRLAAADTYTDRRWRRLLGTEVPGVTADPFLPELAERLNNLTLAGFDATLLVRPAAAAGRYPMITPPQPSGGASSTGYPHRRRRRTLQLPAPFQRPGERPRRHTSRRHRGRARHRLPRARAAEVNASRRWRSFGGLLPEPPDQYQAALTPRVAAALRAAMRRAHGRCVGGTFIGQYRVAANAVCSGERPRMPG